MTNSDTVLASYRDRALRLETEKRERAEDLKELYKEAKGTGLSKDDVAGIKLAVRRHFETEDRKASRLTAEEVAASLEAMAGTPLADAAIARARAA